MYIQNLSFHLLRVAFLIHLLLFFFLLVVTTFVKKAREPVQIPITSTTATAAHLSILESSTFETKYELAFTVARDTLFIFIAAYIMTMTGDIADTTTYVLAWIGLMLTIIATVVAVVTGNARITGIPTLAACVVFIALTGLSFRSVY